MFGCGGPAKVCKEYTGAGLAAISGVGIGGYF
jgi:hypothetical protein